MGYDPLRKLYTPDFQPPDQMGWQDMGDDQQVNISPAVGAFQSRFMGGNKGDMNNMPVNHDLPMDMGGMDAGGGSPMKGKGLKSL
jgi:hypothetical protein